MVIQADIVTIHVEPAELMRWKLDRLKEWADAMATESVHKQYGRDVATILEVESMDEAMEGADHE